MSLPQAKDELVLLLILGKNIVGYFVKCLLPETLNWHNAILYSVNLIGQNSH